MRLIKVDASSVPYGEQVSRNGRTCWAAFHDAEFVCCAAARDECWTKYRDWFAEHERVRLEAKRADSGQDKATPMPDP
jgi:hypothetical protein